MLGADVVVAELESFPKRQLEDLLGARGERDVTGRLLLALADDVLDLLADRVQRDTERFKSLGCNALTLVDEPEQDVLGPDVIVVEHLGLFLGQNYDATSAVGKSLKHVRSLGTGQGWVPYKKSNHRCRRNERCSLKALRDGTAGHAS